MFSHADVDKNKLYAPANVLLLTVFICHTFHRPSAFANVLFLAIYIYARHMHVNHCCKYLHVNSFFTMLFVDRYLRIADQMTWCHKIIIQSKLSPR